MSLKEYKEKRNFDRTSEPDGEKPGTDGYRETSPLYPSENKTGAESSGENDGTASGGQLPETEKNRQANSGDKQVGESGYGSTSGIYRDSESKETENGPNALADTGLSDGTAGAAENPSGPPKSLSEDIKRIFVVQKHDASRLHFDFRLEEDGVLKSWAVPKGPSMNPHDKRLAVEVEDHPLEYADFQGEIPQGEYGAGIVEIWDKGTYTYTGDELDIRIAMKNGLVEVTLDGQKLKGAFTLVRTRMDGQEKNWLLIKKDDRYAVRTEYDAADIPA